MHFQANFLNQILNGFFRCRLSNCQKELVDEREMIKALRSNQTGWENKCTQLEEKFEKYKTEKETEISNLKDEIRDLMFYMEAQNHFASTTSKEDIDNLTVSISQPPETSSSSDKKNRRKKK